MTDLLWPFASFGIVTAIVLVGVLLIWHIFRERRSGFPLQDERTQRITGKAATYALYIGSYFMIALMWIRLLGKEFQGFPALDMDYALVSSILVLSVSFMILSWYFGRRADS